MVAHNACLACCKRLQERVVAHHRPAEQRWNGVLCYNLSLLLLKRLTRHGATIPGAHHLVVYINAVWYSPALEQLACRGSVTQVPNIVFSHEALQKVLIAATWLMMMLMVNAACCVHTIQKTPLLPLLRFPL